MLTFVTPLKYFPYDLGYFLSSVQHTLALQNPRFREAKRLPQHGFKCFSQNDEDGILQEIFRRIGCSGQRFIEIGAGNGKENNTVLLLLLGWHGFWVEGSPKLCKGIRAMHQDAIEARTLTLANALVDAGNVNRLIRETGRLSGEIDLLSIDIDGNDYWVWQKVDAVQPRVVVIEYNAALHPPVSLVSRYDARRSWDGTNYMGASLKALEKLGIAKGYSLVGCSLAGTNAFFVRNDLLGDSFCAPYTAENHYEPPRYFTFRAGHPAGMGPYVAV